MTPGLPPPSPPNLLEFSPRDCAPRPYDDILSGEGEPTCEDIILDLPTRRLRIGTRFFQAPSAILELEELLRDYPNAQEALQGSARGRALARLLRLAPTPEA